MTILALDSSGLVASAAILTDFQLRAEYSVNYKKTHSQTLLPMIQEIMEMTETDMEDVDAIALASGPGSFTGLRIGSATAKGLGLATGKPLIPVPTLEGLAYQYYGTDWQVCPVMDARRSQVYTGLYEFAEGFQVQMEQTVISVEELLNHVNETGKKTLFLGDGTLRYKKEMEELVGVPYQLAPPHRNQQSAAAVAVRAAELWAAGVRVTADAFVPEYLRLSQAERERKEKLEKEGEQRSDYAETV